MDKTSAAPNIVVAGDVCIDWLSTPVIWDQSPANGEQVANWRMKEGTKMFPRDGGAWLLAEMVSVVAGQKVSSQQKPDPLEHEGCEKVLHSIVDLMPFASKKGDRDHIRDVWRVDRFRGFAGPNSGSTEPCMIRTGDDNPTAEIVVLDDVGNGFRHRKKDWPAALTNDGHSPLVIWKLARPFGESDLLDLLRAQHASKTIVVLDVDDLRAEGANISRQLSWERTAGQLMHALLYDPRFPNLRQFAHLIVRLDLEGALYMSLPDPYLSEPAKEKTGAELTYLPTGIEGATRAEFPGRMLGLTSVFVAYLVAELAGPQSEGLRCAIMDGVKDGVSAARTLFQQGFGPANLPAVKVSDLLKPEISVDPQLRSVQIAPLAGFNEKSRLIEYVRTVPLYNIATQIVNKGVHASKSDPPIAKFGKLETLDRVEMEAFRGIGNLIGEYLSLPNPERPLSIAVFGSPGSGKSFGVSEVAKSLADVEKIEFNISQYETASQLTAAFHSVRDAVVRGKVPLVFFDEFDATLRGEKLAWLRHFLAPMQDGKFTDGESTHHIGKSVFVFAGGTKETYEEFAHCKVDAAGDDKAKETAEKAKREFGEAKGPDFVSRLRGFINIRGVDRREHDDEMSVIRRAVVLRSLLERKAAQLIDLKGELRIDDGVLRAYLRCRAFRHGARSMEAIIDMSQLSGRRVFERSCLPSPQQLSLHVNADEFLSLVNLDVSLSQHRERIAQAIHDFFLETQKGEDRKGDAAMEPWATLSENFRDSNRAQADDIPRKLALVNCAYRPIAEGYDGKLLEFNKDEVEAIAEAEHDRWNDEKRAKGYRYAPGPKSDVPPRHNPWILPWVDLPEKEKDKDRKTSAEIPAYLMGAGFEVYRLDEKQAPIDWVDSLVAKAKAAGADSKGEKLLTREEIDNR